jgi:BirA family biotin operon repressor/biotin-[acetyl-CoA-carboxylase] ligase
LRVVTSTASTNADVAAAARSGAPEGLVVVAEVQTAGRGRLDRTWSAPPRSALTFSVLLRPVDVPRQRWGWLSLLSGLAVTDALSAVADLPAAVKWPNDVLVADRKIAGVLAEVVGSAVVVGIGLNVSLHQEELPVATATSMLIAGASTTDRDTVLRAVLRALARRYGQWRSPAGAGDLPVDYRAASATIGQRVRVELPGGSPLTGEAVTVDDDGRLVVRASDGTLTAVGAGDVVHVRPV